MLTRLNHFFIATLSFLLAMVSTFSAYACTGIQLIAKDGSAINGRTAEFGIPLNPQILIIPRNYIFSASLPDGSKGMSYQSKYGFVGIAPNNGQTAIDGLNEAGLTVAAFYFPGYAGYASLNDQNKMKALSPMDFPNWVLSQFATIAKVKTALNGMAIVPTFFKPWNTVPPFHYIVYDKSGKSIVIEPVNGKLVVYNNPIGVITNSPTFDWHLTNLKNYINLSPINVDQITVDGVTLKAFGQGSGLYGLPGDFSPPSRFVRAAIFSTTAISSENAKQAVLQTFHILNQFDIPAGSVRSVSQGKVVDDTTQATSVKDPRNLNYYFKTYDNQNIQKVNLKAFDLNAKAVKTIQPSDEQPILDVSSTAK